MAALSPTRQLAPAGGALLARPAAMPSPLREAERLAALRARRLLDTPASESFDRITRLASRVFHTSIALVTFMDVDRLWFKSRVGVDATETERSTAICDYTIRGRGVLVVEDLAQDRRFADSPMLAAGYRFYAGAPLLTRSGHALGTLCILDREARRFGPDDRRQLADLAAMAMSQVDLHQGLGRTDEVTGLPNRTQLVCDLEDLCALTPGEHRTFVLVEAYSQQQLQQAQRVVGAKPLEAVVRDFAAQLAEWVGDQATLYKVNEARFGFMLAGDEPALLQAQVAQLVEHVQRPLRGGRSQIDMDQSPVVGIAAFQLSPESAGDVIRRAASALHQAQQTDRAFAWFAEQTDASGRRAFALLQDIPCGLAEGEFRLVYQPKMDLRSRQYKGVEALIRWNHPRLGALSPAEFIPLVESSRLIHPVTEWVMHTALAQLAEWTSQGLNLTMAVNVSAKNLEHPDFVKIVRNACDLHQIVPSQLHIECTENAALDSAQTLRTLNAIRALGVQVSLDDFGIGYCNFSCLHSLPAELLKLDQSLIKPIATDPRSWELLKSIIRFGQALGYRLLAEGVETAEVFDMLESSGCDAVQGYYLSRPLEAAAIPPFVSRHLELFTLDA
ncbi:sensor domain-containing phosphodiesterase [Xylophilus sp. GOD-11R]|uniref:putative bifunctional diguanylate cyclase/phosphodiesterase n=1 Tax=Xylophilus sp. GOD-11R TaxID=3089814 RepID=UPI00298D4780|nr:sensor domain-containing phosphodiesterase [Xylophilus sp. GOD-11R]WPB55419.1 sensor domain-containing phosphodiesterase [Xylophilus sp. GOD-11R]